MAQGSTGHWSGGCICELGRGTGTRGFTWSRVSLSFPEALQSALGAWTGLRCPGRRQRGPVWHRL